MKRICITLPNLYRVDLSLTKTRKRDPKSLAASLGEIRRVRIGSKLSRLGRLIFQHKSVKKVLGANLALAFFASSFINPISKPIDLEETVIPVDEIALVLKTEESIRYPVDEIIITQGYSFYHPAYDLDGLTGDPIYSIKSGYVRAAGFSKVGYGKAILIDHGDETVSLYAHLSEILVEPGEVVTTGDVIGEMGATGRSYGDHLHLEIRVKGKPINPSTFIGE